MTTPEWRIIFCSDCHEPVPPAQLKRYGRQMLCPDCVTDLLTNQPEPRVQPD